MTSIPTSHPILKPPTRLSNLLDLHDEASLHHLPEALLSIPPPSTSQTSSSPLPPPPPYVFSEVEKYQVEVRDPPPDPSTIPTLSATPLISPSKTLVRMRQIRNELALELHGLPSHPSQPPSSRLAKEHILLWENYFWLRQNALDRPCEAYSFGAAEEIVRLESVNRDDGIGKDFEDRESSIDYWREEKHGYDSVIQDLHKESIPWLYYRLLVRAQQGMGYIEGDSTDVATSIHRFAPTQPGDWKVVNSMKGRLRIQKEV